MKQKELDKILELHKKWLNDEDGGVRANLKYANLRNANLRNAYLTDADLKNADLKNANLCGAYLRFADLEGAYLTGAYLTGANLKGANLKGADLTGADLTGAYLANANLKGADLTNANLKGADLTNANLTSADLRGANLKGAYLENSKLPDFKIIPEEGEFIGFKKLINGNIAKLLIPSDAKRMNSLNGRRCRAEFVKVIEIIGESGKAEYNYGTVYRLPENKTYEVGETLHADKYDDDIRVECANGILFLKQSKKPKTGRKAFY